MKDLLLCCSPFLFGIFMVVSCVPQYLDVLEPLDSRYDYSLLEDCDLIGEVQLADKRYNKWMCANPSEKLISILKANNLYAYSAANGNRF